jgi:hypothetical protein
VSSGTKLIRFQTAVQTKDVQPLAALRTLATYINNQKIYAITGEIELDNTSSRNSSVQNIVIRGHVIWS